jgi:DNA sulfur modification protein DndD
MKLLKAKISNFRILRDIELDFSTSAEAPLTVIRAANETGKTTCLNALVWALYGSKALPGRGDFVLFPAGSDESPEKGADISVEIDFEIEQVASLGRGKLTHETQTYRIRRSCREKMAEGSFKRDAEVVKLWRFSPTGTTPIDEDEIPSIVDQALPETLKDVYFTDGDSAMSFIEAAATTGVKRQRVARAIESLLGLEVLDKTTRHLKSIANDFSAKIDSKDYRAELERVQDSITSYEEDIQEWTQEKEDAEDYLKKATTELKKQQLKLEEALQAGDLDSLNKEGSEAEKRFVQATRRKEAELDRLAQLCSSESLSIAFIGRELRSAVDELEKLHEKRQLPKVNIPILEDLLSRSNCFCGSDLSGEDAASKQRRAKISEQIDASRESDKAQEALSALFYQVRSLRPKDEAEAWLRAYAEQSEALQEWDAALKKAEDDVKSVKEKLAQIDDDAITRIRGQIETLENSVRAHAGKIDARAAQIQEKNERLDDAKREEKRIRNKVGVKDVNSKYWALSSQARDVFSTVIEKLKRDELQNVSEEMNRIFLSMIGYSAANRSEFSSIQRAELTEDFDICVYGRNNHRLDPDKDLNGASRRAITLSFILALTNVSGADAPNIIDTPLGMTSGYVKQSMLDNIIKEGSQPILFLTHDEIKGIEPFLDTHAGCVYTLTNPAHYPTMLVNEPADKEAGVIRCECSHRESCEICARKDREVA